VSEDSSGAVWLPQARSYLRHADPVLARLIDARPTFDPRAWMAQLPRMDLYGALLFQVTGQQLSVPATRRTLARIEALFGGHLPAPAELLGVDPGQLRQAGLSWRKVSTLRDLAERMTDGRLNQDVLSTLPDDELVTELTAIPGIGPWTVQGAMLIALQREDVVLPGDLALRKAIQAVYRHPMVFACATSARILPLLRSTRSSSSFGRNPSITPGRCDAAPAPGGLRPVPARRVQADARLLGHRVDTAGRAWITEIR
jgi:DNA-3-methyladenine glycosylase II